MARDRLVTVDQLDDMTPNERSEAVRASVVTDLQTLPEEFRARIERKARLLDEGIKTSRSST